MKPLQDLFGQWLEAGGDWQKSKVFIESTNKEGTVDTDTRGWVTLAELEHKMGHVGAESMVNYLEQNRPDQCRDHPDAPGVKDTSLSCPLESHDQKNVRMGHFIIPYWGIYICICIYMLLVMVA